MKYLYMIIGFGMGVTLASIALNRPNTINFEVAQCVRELGSSTLEIVTVVTDHGRIETILVSGYSRGRRAVYENGDYLILVNCTDKYFKTEPETER